MADFGNLPLNRGDLVEAFDEQGRSLGRFRISRVVNPRVVKVVDEDGIVKSFHPDRLKLVNRGR
jgi:hypothetical protein